MEIAAQQESRGILYEGYQNEFKQCIFEDSGVQGRNERYEFRCDANLECCGRVCCTPEDATVPLWLMILFILLALVLLAAILGFLAYLLSKRKPKPKKVSVYRPDINQYRSIKHADDESAGFNIDKDAHGYGNRGYDQAGAGAEDSSLEDARNVNTAQLQRYNGGRNGGVRGSLSDDAYGRGGEGIYGRGGYRPVPPPPSRYHEHETFEEEFKEEYEIERNGSVKKFIPSPMEETLLEKPKPVKIIQHNEDEISRASVPETVEMSPPPAQKAQLAFYRPFVPDHVEEHEMPSPSRAQVSYHDASELTIAKQPSYSTLERPKERRAEFMYTRPGFDNVPSY